MQQLSSSDKLKLLLTRFFLPHPIDLVPYALISLLILLIGSNRVLLEILADGTPITPLPVGEVFGQRLDHMTALLGIPILGRIVLFMFWLGIGSVVYVAVWLFQNLAIEVYDNLSTTKFKEPASDDSEDGWWGTSLAHTIFICSSALLFLLYMVIVVNFLYPAWLQLFEMGLQTISEAASFVKTIIALLGTMITLHILVLFWKIFIRVRNLIYNNFY